MLDCPPSRGTVRGSPPCSEWVRRNRFRREEPLRSSAHDILIPILKAHADSVNPGPIDAEARARGFRLLSAAYLAFAVRRREASGPVLCPYRRVTGHRCPLCGLTRGIGLALRGKFARSAQQHPAAPIMVPLLLSSVAIGPSETAKFIRLGRRTG
jgi:Protein of unknown function (DUF2752)